MHREHRRDRSPAWVDDVFHRGFAGPQASEVYFLCRPRPAANRSLRRQTEDVYRQLEETLSAFGGSLEHVIKETVFFRDHADHDAFLSTRRAYLDGAAGSYRPVSTFIAQPPLDARARVEILGSAVIPLSGELVVSREVRCHPPCACDPCEEVNARAFELGGELHIHAGNICGRPGNTFDEAYSMFCAAQEILEEEGAEFRDVVRTWIYLRDMERDYAELNRARREFFRSSRVTLFPASTGIHGSPHPCEHSFSMSFHALRSAEPLAVRPMTAPTLNEASAYGSDFSRGLRVEEANKVTLYVSGTASVDEEGRTACAGDFEAQMDRMLLNISSLLALQGASFRDLVSAVTYLRRPEDARRLYRLLEARGIRGFPHAMVAAPVCRPDLLCEMEAVGVLPRQVSRR